MLSPPLLKSRSTRGLAAVLFAAASAAAVLCQPSPAAAQPALELEAPAGGDTGGISTIGVVALSGYDNLLDDVGYLGTMAGFPEAVQMIEGTINLFTQQQGLVGLDKARPWGVMVQFDGQQPLPIICLPITDLDAILGLAEGFGVMSADAGGGVMELSVPQSPQPLFAKSVGEWVYVGQSAEILDTAPADPTELLDGLVKDYDIGASLLAKNVPAALKQMALDAMSSGMEDGMERLPDETDEEYAQRKALADAQLDQFRDLVRDTDEMTVGIAINKPGQSALLVDFMMTAQEGSDLTAQFATLMPAPSDMAGFADPGASISMLQSSKTDPEKLDEYVEQTKAQLDPVRKMIAKEIEESDDVPNDETREVLMSAFDGAWEALEETLKTGRVDFGAHVLLDSDELGAVMGTKFSKPEKIEESLRKLEALAADDPDFPGVNWDAASHEGVAFHTMSIPVPDAEAAQVLGDTVEVAVGIGADMICIGMGPTAVDSLIQAIDNSAAQAGKQVEPFEMVMSVKQIADFAIRMSGDNPGAAMAGAMLDGMDDEESRINLTVSPIENGSRFRMTMQEGLLQTLGKVAAMAARQAGAGGPPPF
ncbi:MAG: hypothetical protein AAF790_11630 [Planctomycetota bacterium]